MSCTPDDARGRAAAEGLEIVWRGIHAGAGQHLAGTPDDDPEPPD